MSLETRVEKLESHFDSLDSAVRSLIKITEETHQIVLENQRENRIRFDQQDRKIEANQRENRIRFDQQDRKIEANQQENRECFDQLELLIRQSLPTN